MNEGSHREITETPRETEEHYSAIIENMADAITINVGTDRVFVNKAFLNLVGLDEESQVLGTPLDQFIVPEDRQLVSERTLARQRGQSVPGIYEYRIRRADGEVRTVQTSSVPITYKGTSATLAVLRDFTDRKQAEAALRASEKRAREQLAELELLYDTAPLGLCTMDTELRYWRCNERLAEINGIPSADHIGRTLREIVPEIAETMEQVYRHVIESGESAIDVVATGVTAADPTHLRHFSACYYPVKSEAGVVRGVSSIVRDITEAKRAEEETRKARHYLTRLIESATDAIISTDKEGNVVLFNHGAEAMLGYTREEVLGQRVTVVYESEERAKEVMKRMRQGGGTVVGFETILRAKDGTLIPVLISVSTLFDAQGQEAGTVGFNKDLRDRKRTEEALRASSLRLVEAQETERRHIARELHDDISQVLTGLKLTLETNACLPAGEIGDSLVEAAAVVNDIMRKVRELSLSLRPPMLDDFGLLPALIWHFEQYTTRTNVHVTASNLAGLDGRRFRPDIETAAYRIVQEGLTNIARHAGVREARVAFWIDHTTLYVQIQDHGTGFDPEAVQAARFCSGLAGMRERVALLNGYFTLESAPGAGTQLTVELPLHDSADRGTEDGRDDRTVSG